MLAASPKTRKEITQKLTDKGYPKDVIDLTVGQLEKQKVLDDRAYALNLINRFSVIQPSGRQRITFEMKRHGIPAAIQEELLNDWNKEAEVARAEDAARARWERLNRLPAEKKTKRIYDFLLRRGFDFQICREVTTKLTHSDED